MTVPAGSYAVGMGAPYVLPYVCTLRAGDTWDPLTVTDASMSLRAPNGDVRVMPNGRLSLSGVSPTGLTVELELDAADLDQAGHWVCSPRLTVPGGELVCDPVGFYVRGAFET